MTKNLDELIPSADEVMRKMALAEAEKAAEAFRKHAQVEAQKKAEIDRLAGFIGAIGGGKNRIRRQGH